MLAKNLYLCSFMLYIRSSVDLENYVGVCMATSQYSPSLLAGMGAAQDGRLILSATRTENICTAPTIFRVFSYVAVCCFSHGRGKCCSKTQGARFMWRAARRSS